MDKESIVISIILLFLVLTVTLFSFGTFTGVMAVTDTSTGNVSVTITEVTDINFTTNVVAFGTGSVNAGTTQAELISTGTAATNGSWTWTAQQLVLENIGSEDVALDIKSDVNASTLINGTSPRFQWNATEGEAASCIGTINVTNLFTTSWADVNITGDGTRLCATFDATGVSDLINIQFRLVIPVDTTVAGSRSAIITAKGTS